MKKILVAILVVILSVGCFAGCSAQEADGENTSVVPAEKDSPLVGCWVRETEYSKTAMQFFPNGIVVKAEITAASGHFSEYYFSYFIENDFLCIYKEDGSDVRPSEFSVNGNELTITSGSTNQTFVRWETSIVDYMRNQED